MVTWLPVPDGYVHGILRGYRLLFEIDENSFNQNVTTVNQSFELAGLEKFTNYSIKVLAFTRIGDGNVSDPVIVSTDEDGKLLAYLHHSLIRRQNFYANYTHKQPLLHKFYFQNTIRPEFLLYKEYCAYKDIGYEQIKLERKPDKQNLSFLHSTRYKLSRILKSGNLLVNLLRYILLCEGTSRVLSDVSLLVKSANTGLDLLVHR